MHRFELSFGLVLFAIPPAVMAAPFVPARNAQCVAFSPDGKWVATGTSGLSNGEYPPRPHPSVRKAAVIQIWDASSGQKLRRMETYGDLTKIEFASGGKSIISARLFSPGDGTQLNEVRIWDATTGKTLHQFEGCHAFALHPGGESLAVLSRSKCVVYSISGKERLREIPTLGGAIAITISPDGKHLAGICRIDGKYGLRVCTSDEDELVAASATLDQPFYSLAIGGGEQRIATGHPGGIVVLWDLLTLKPTDRLTSGGKGLQHPFFSPDGTVLGSGDQENGDVVFWNVRDGQELRRYTFERGTFTTHFPRSPEQVVRPEKDPARFVFSPDGESFLSGPYGGIIRLVSTGQDTRRFGD